MTRRAPRSGVPALPKTLGALTACCRELRLSRVGSTAPPNDRCLRLRDAAAPELGRSWTSQFDPNQPVGRSYSNRRSPNHFNPPSGGVQSNRRGRDSGPLLNHLVRAQQQRLRDCDAECLRGFKIDHQLILRGLLNRKVRWLGAFQDLVGIYRSATK
jgi:hypothetical protein